MTIFELKTGRTVPFLDAPVMIALGNFDGVHAGHAKVIGTAVEEAVRHGVKSAVWCFEKLPFAGWNSVITDNSEKLGLFAELSADYAIFEDFDLVKGLAPDEFVNDYLKAIGCVGAFCGFNFSFGKDASGNSAMLSELCGKNGMIFGEIPPVTVGGEIVSSSAVRRYLSEGNVKKCAEMLGRPYSVCGKVRHGRALGKKLGFPTVNISFENGKVIPAHGVYFTRAFYRGSFHPAVSDVGFRPTVGGHECRIETHIIGCSDDLYGENIKVLFEEFRRYEKEFNGENELICAIRGDTEAAAEYFAVPMSCADSDKE